MAYNLRNGQVGKTKLVGIDMTGFPSNVFIDLHVIFTVMPCSIEKRYSDIKGNQTQHPAVRLLALVTLARLILCWFLPPTQK